MLEIAYTIIIFITIVLNLVFTCIHSIAINQQNMLKFAPDSAPGFDFLDNKYG